MLDLQQVQKQPTNIKETDLVFDCGNGFDLLNM